MLWPAAFFSRSMRSISVAPLLVTTSCSCERKFETRLTRSIRVHADLGLAQWLPAEQCEMARRERWRAGQDVPSRQPRNQWKSQLPFDDLAQWFAADRFDDVGHHFCRHCVSCELFLIQLDLQHRLTGNLFGGYIVGPGNLV